MSLIHAHLGDALAAPQTRWPLRRFPAIPPPLILEGMPARTRRNRSALVHGAFSSSQLLPGESAEELEALRESFRSEFLPAPGPETALVEELVSTAHRLRRLDQADQILAAFGSDKYLAEGPTLAEDQPVPTETPAARLEALRKARRGLSAGIDDDVRQLAEFDMVFDADGVEATADFVCQWRREFDEHFIPITEPKALLAPIPTTYEEPVAYWKNAKDVFRRFIRNQKDRLRALDREILTLEFHIRAVFAAGLGRELDPGAADHSRIGKERRRHLMAFERCLRMLAQTRMLSGVVHGDQDGRDIAPKPLKVLK